MRRRIKSTHIDADYAVPIDAEARAAKRRRTAGSGAVSPELRLFRLWDRSGRAYRLTRTAIDLVDRGQPAVMPAALAGRRCECRRDERRDPARRDRDGVEAARQRDLEQFAPDWPLHGHRPRHDRDDQAERHGRARDGAAWAKEAPEPGWHGEQSTGDVEDPGTRRARSRVLDRCPEGDTRILAAFPRAQCFFLRRRGGAAARRPGR